MYVSIHDATFEPSTGIKHNVNLLRVMRNIIGINESSRPFYLVGLDIYGDGDHNHKHIQNQLALFGIFLLGKMDKINVIRGCSGLSFINTAERAGVF